MGANQLQAQYLQTSHQPQIASPHLTSYGSPYAPTLGYNHQSVGQFFQQPQSRVALPSQAPYAQNFGSPGTRPRTYSTSAVPPNAQHLREIQQLQNFEQKAHLQDLETENSLLKAKTSAQEHELLAQRQRLNRIEANLQAQQERSRRTSLQSQPDSSPRSHASRDSIDMGEPFGYEQLPRIPVSMGGAPPSEISGDRRSPNRQSTLRAPASHPELYAGTPRTDYVPTPRFRDNLEPLSSHRSHRSEDLGAFLKPSAANNSTAALLSPRVKLYGTTELPSSSTYRAPAYLSPRLGNDLPAPSPNAIPPRRTSPLSPRTRPLEEQSASGEQYGRTYEGSPYTPRTRFDQHVNVVEPSEYDRLNTRDPVLIDDDDDDYGNPIDSEKLFYPNFGHRRSSAQ